MKKTEKNRQATFILDLSTKMMDQDGEQNRLFSFVNEKHWKSLIISNI